jgi:HK97 family phage major capsid protein
MRGIVEAADVLTPEQDTEYKGHEAKLAGINAAIEREERLEAEEQSVATKAAAKPETEKAKIAAVAGEPNESKRPWTNGSEFYGAVVQAFSPGGDVDPRLYGAASGMNQAIPSEGGFLVAPEFSKMIWDGLSSDPDSLLSMTDNYTVTGESITFNANAETSRATGSRYGGVQGYWLNEADQMTKSKPKFRQIKLEPQQLAVLVYLTEKLMRNSGTALEQYVSRAATDEIKFLVGDSIINGTGSGQPKGFLAANATIQVSKETSQPAATIQQENISKMWARLHPRSRAGGVAPQRGHRAAARLPEHRDQERSRHRERRWLREQGVGRREAHPEGPSAGSDRILRDPGHRG